jgi:predicted branched-subunit amino acid permease
MLENLKNNPVRIMATLTAVLALVVFYVPSLPVVLILGIPAAILGTGEVVRAKVTPVRNIDA